MSGDWFVDGGGHRWAIVLPDPGEARRALDRIAARAAETGRAPLHLQLDDGTDYGHDELVEVAQSSVAMVASILDGSTVDEADLDDLAAAVNNLRIVAIAIALTEGADGGDDVWVMGIISYLSRLLEEAVGALDRSVISLPDGRFRVRWRESDREMVQTLADELDGALEADDPDLARLFPPAYGTDETRSREYDALARHELIDSRRAALDTLRSSMNADDLTADDLSTLMRAVNDLRLVVGTRLDVSEDSRPKVSPRHPSFPDWLAYERLTHLLAQLVVALS